jgi:small subunit ribosomal protein S15
MAVAKQTKADLLKKYGKSGLDTGSSEVQIALLTQKINELTRHFTEHKKDVHGRRGMVIAVNRRRKLLDYLKRKDLARYNAIISSLQIRK